jgi:hypothetical protein
LALFNSFLQEQERAALIAAAQEAERARVKVARRAEADRKAGIDRRLVDMSAAEKRAIERREREKKEAEKRRWGSATAVQVAVPRSQDALLVCAFVDASSGVVGCKQDAGMAAADESAAFGS